MAKSDLLAHSVAMCALKSYSSRNADRSAISDGKNYDCIELNVRGSVGKKKVSFSFAGRLSVGEANPTGSTSKPASDKLLAAAMAYMPKTKIKQMIADVEASRLKSPNDDDIKKARAIIDRLSTKKPRAGAVSFVEG